MNGDRELEMEMRRRTILAACFLASALCLPEAKAGVIVENFTITGTGIAGSGTITLTTTGNPAVDEITALSGFFSTTNNGGFSGAITGLNPGSYDASSPSTDYYSTWDNLFYPTGSPSACGLGTPASGSLLDWCGVDFLVAGGYEVNVFGSIAPTVEYQLSDGLSGGTSYIDNDPTVNFQVSPEPASFTLLGTGLLGMAVILFRKTRPSGLVP